MYICFGAILSVMRRVKRVLKGEGSSAEYTAVVSEFRRYNPQSAILPWANELRQFITENRNQEGVVLGQAAPQN